MIPPTEDRRLTYEVILAFVSRVMVLESQPTRNDTLPLHESLRMQKIVKFSAFLLLGARKGIRPIKIYSKTHC